MTDHPSKIGKYQIRGLLGGGGMAQVYEGYDPVGDRVLAVKVLRAEFANSPEVVASFVQEAKKAIRLESHDAVLTVYEVDQDGDKPFIAMRRVDGRTLQEELRKRGVLPVDRVRGIVASVGGALEHAHQRGIVHCDVKPSNIMLDRVGRAYLMDFGISRAFGDMLGARLDELSAFTPQYASPEQTSGHPATVRSDIYSFGVVLYEMVTGTTPFGHCQTAAELRQAVVHEQPCAPRDVNPHVPVALDKAILRALAKDPAARFETMAQLVEAALDATDSGPATDVTMMPKRATESATTGSKVTDASVPSTQPAPTATPQRSQAAVAGVLLLTASIAVAGVFGWNWWRERSAGDNGANGATMRSLAAATTGAAEPGDGRFGSDKDSPNEHGPDQDIAVPEPTHSASNSASNTAVGAGQAPTLPDTSVATLPKADALVVPPGSGEATRAEQPVTQASTDSAPELASTAARQDAKADAPPLPAPHAYSLPAGWKVEILDPTPCALTTLPRRVRDTATGIEFVLVPPGRFRMGAADADLEAAADERPQHWVRIERPFYMATTEVTMGQWRQYVAQAHASQAPLEDLRKRMHRPGLANAPWSDEHPVLRVTWSEATAFCGHYGFHLPTEAQWEYACRAGTETVYWFGDDQRDATGVENVLDGNAKAASVTTADQGFEDPAWGASDEFLITAPVGHFRANPLGLYDMHGNVSEWCHDGYFTDAYQVLGNTDPVAQNGDWKVVRGGSWKTGPRTARSSSRQGRKDERHYDVGFRVTHAIGAATK